MAILLLTTPLMAQEKKTDEKSELPRVSTVTPFSVLRGQKTTLQIRGLFLADATTVRIESADGPVACVIKGQDKIESTKRAKVAKPGDSQLTVEIDLSADSTAETLSLVITTPKGQTAPISLVAFAKKTLIEEVEPNGGFREAQAIERGKTVRGLIEDPTDVDVFKFTGKAGENIVAEVRARRHGSALDSLLTLYSEKGNTIASNDDSEAGADSILKVKLPADGLYYLSLSDAQGTGGPAHGYLLTLRNAPSTTQPAASVKP